MMSSLTDEQRQEIVRLIQAGEALPPGYQSLLFPQEADYLDLTRSIPTQLVDRTSHDLSVLVVDDSESIRVLLLELLSLMGYTADSAEDGTQGLEMLLARPYDLVLSDIMMPRMDGYQMLESIKTNPSLQHIPVVVVSALQEVDSVVRCLELGAEDYLFKPIQSVLFEARVNASLEKKWLRDQEQAHLRQLEVEQARSERLLHNILPASIVQKLKEGSDRLAEAYADVTVLFADIVSFSQVSSTISPAALVNLLNQVFSTFDQLAEKHGVEKIKTIGDAYMIVGGLPTPRPDHAEAVAEMALDMQTAITRFDNPQGEPLSLRIGINTGPVVAGVIGTQKFSYDLWGDTVNIASRMEAHGLGGVIQVAPATYQRLRGSYQFTERGKINVRGRGKMSTYLLTGRKQE
jgi:adenylate cyclase